MTRTRAILLGVPAVLVAGWLTSASLPSAPVETPAARPARPDAAAAAPSLFEVDDAAERLRVRRRDTPSPRGGRNPFEFAAREAPPRPVAAAAPAPVAPAAPATPPPPPLTLSGIVDRTEGDQQVRTAVISGMGQLFFAKAGDTIATRYQVTTITTDVVELRDIYSTQIVRLVLK